MENFLLSLICGVIGAVLGSFSVAQVWRLRAKQLQEERESGKKVDSNEWKKLHSLVSVKTKNDRSHCLNCNYQLKWFDLIPIISWLSLGGKCRKCRSKIGSLEFLSEILMFALFAIIFLIFNPISNGTILVLPAIRLFILLISLVPL
ncbi:MAG: prepilin peptidase, partial [Candidatus Saccharimonas sp.]